ncbi:cell wall-binding repeat-containing protein [Herbiconiux sp. CPCC 205763]|uniref:Cell wall-binding repeat-containing protein n=1 Tax=Herbiconiux aconitum TaxID=2970913 RepID=A0ABT2GUD4_9MICO|nr:cell wall-binding repeat-containing protein [Herbiconiux aconitum]MCS5719814.1 cell wall-binding repeat-containing protein [Herbiconiux aconitum]
MASALSMIIVVIWSLVAVQPASAGELEPSMHCVVECGALQATPNVTRIRGVDRYDQAVQVTNSAFASADTVYLASGEKFADALSAGAIAGIHDSPLLLTPAAALTSGTRAEIMGLRPRTIVVVGGPASVHDSVLDELKSLVPGVTVKRIGGIDRYAVSRALIVDPDFGITSSSWLFVAAGSNFPDALAASPAATKLRAPVLLVDNGAATLSLSDVRLLGNLGVQFVRIVGGPASVSDSLAFSFGAHASVDRAGGADRFEVAVSVNEMAFSTAATVYLASGLVFPDALSAAPIAGRSGSPIYLVPRDCVPDRVLQEITRLAVTKVIVLGGSDTISPEVESLKRCN